MPFSISTVSCVGEPSSSTLSEPRRLGIVPLSTTVTFETGDRLADETGEGGGLLAVEVGFEAVADGFMQQNAGPAGAEHDFHLARGRGHGSELQDRLARGFVGEVFGRLVAVEEVELARGRRRPRCRARCCRLLSR